MVDKLRGYVVTYNEIIISKYNYIYLLHCIVKFISYIGIISIPYHMLEKKSHQISCYMSKEKKKQSVNKRP